MDRTCFDVAQTVASQGVVEFACLSSEGCEDAQSDFELSVGLLEEAAAAVKSKVADLDDIDV